MIPCNVMLISPTPVCIASASTGLFEMLELSEVAAPELTTALLVGK